jgi:HAMP domain-containing protein
MTSLATDLRNLARRVAANRPEHRNPEAFAIEKQEIADEFFRLARSVDRQEANYYGYD